MSEPISSGRRTAVRIRLVLEILLLVSAALVVYFGFIRERGPRHLKLALVTWTQDPFWEPLIRGDPGICGQIQRRAHRHPVEAFGG